MDYSPFIIRLEQKIIFNSFSNHFQINFRSFQFYSHFFKIYCNTWFSTLLLLLGIYIHNLLFNDFPFYIHNMTLTRFSDSKILFWHGASRQILGLQIRPTDLQSLERTRHNPLRIPLLNKVPFSILVSPYFKADLFPCIWRSGRCPHSTWKSHFNKWGWTEWHTSQSTFSYAEILRRLSIPRS